MNPQTRLIIELMPDGRVNMNGPLGNKTLCYGLLEVAKDIVRDWTKDNEKRVKLVDASILANLKEPTDGLT